jgi:acetolactate synthase-1/2/3 large subunit
MISGVWDTVATTLRQWGVTAVFGLPNDDLAALRALRQQSLRWVLTRDQRNAVFMAGGHSLASGGLSVCVVGKGPALSNALTGLLECNALSAPVLLIATGTAQASVGSGAFQEADQMALVRPLVKWACRVERAERLAWALQRAAFLAVNGHPGPVYLELPEDLQPQADEPLLLASLPAPVRLRSLPAADELQRVQQRLQTARRPLLLLGGGAQQQSDPGLYARFAEAWNAAVFTTASGRGVVAESHPLFCGLAGIYTAAALRTLWSQADVLLVLGSRLEETALALLPQVQAGARWVQVDAEVANFSQRVPSDKLLGDAAGTARHWLASWAAADPAAASARLEWRSRIASLRRQAHAERDLHLARLAQREQLQVADVLVELQASAPANAVFVHENGLADMWSYFFPYFALRDGQRCVVPSEQTSLGFGAAAAVGVKLARPEAPVVALVGDGAFNLFRSDLATAADHALPVIYIVFNNHSLGWLEQQWGSQAEAASPFGFDADLASSRTDVLMLTVRTRSDLRNAMQAAFEVGDGRTVVMDVRLAGVDLAPGLESFYGAAGHTSADEPVLLCAKSGPSAPLDFFLHRGGNREPDPTADKR